MPVADPITLDTIEALWKRLADSRYPADPRCPPHLVHPRYVGPGWEFVSGPDGGLAGTPGLAWVACANLCGTVLVFRRVGA